MSSMLTGFVGAVVEAWAQLRIGKMRVLLSLVGVAVAVAAMTFSIAFVRVSEQVLNDQLERWGGRPGTVRINVSPTGKGLTGSNQPGRATPGDEDGAAGPGDPGLPPGPGGPAGPGGPEAGGAQGSAEAARTAERVTKAQAEFVERFKVRSWATSTRTSLRLQLGDRFRNVEVNAVSPAYATLHRTKIAQGRWFTPEDGDDLSPSLVVSQGVLEELGASVLSAPLTVRSFGPAQATFTIVGVLEPEDLQGCLQPSVDGSEPESCGQPLTAFVLTDSLSPLLPRTHALASPELEVWAGPERAAEMQSLAKEHFDAIFGQGSTSTIDSTLGSGDLASFTRIFTLVATGAGLFVMALGALGLVNISIVTVRQRIHEIGVRRSFGATSRRIFFSIMLESVVATVVAGLVGIIVAILAMRVVPLDKLLQLPVVEQPPFPMLAALIGLATATLVGALAGLVPAVVAVRIKPIDAIRY